MTWSPRSQGKPAGNPKPAAQIQTKTQTDGSSVRSRRAEPWHTPPPRLFFLFVTCPVCIWHNQNFVAKPN
jgi:hypothetical protein